MNADELLEISKLPSPAEVLAAIESVPVATIWLNDCWACYELAYTSVQESREQLAAMARNPATRPRGKGWNRQFVELAAQCLASESRLERKAEEYLDAIRGELMQHLRESRLWWQ